MTGGDGVCTGMGEGCRIDSLICATSALSVFNNAISERIALSSFNTSGCVLPGLSLFGSLFFLSRIESSD